MMDGLTIGFWLALSALGLLAGASQKRGRDYFPANLLLGLALGAPAAFYLTMLCAFHLDYGDLIVWTRAVHSSTYVYGCTTALAVWALYLVIRANLAKPGSAMDLSGHAGPPSREQIDEALSILNRGDYHDTMNAVQRWKAREWLRLMRARKDEAKRAAREEGGW